MIQLNDHYFIAWLNVSKNVSYEMRGNKLYVELQSKDYLNYLEEYKSTIKPVFVKVRSLVKELTEKKLLTNKRSTSQF